MPKSPFIADPLIDTRLGNYRIIRPLGMGGMGKVYFAQDETLKRPVALKVIHEQFRQREDYKARLLGEASAIANLKHPNIVQIYNAGEQAGILFFAMELISGRNLKDLMMEAAADGEPVDFEAVILIGEGIAAALDFAHENGVIHRDVKPGNVLITHEPHVYLTDFGLALDVRDPLREGGGYTVGKGHKVDGTAQYMSPEQIDPALEIGPESDQYSFGILLYEMLTGTVPFDGEDADEIYQKHLNNPPPKPLSLSSKLTPQIQEILLRALAKHPGDRFESCTALMRRLTRALQAAQETGLPQMALPAMPAGTRKYSYDRARHNLPPENIPSDRKVRSDERTLPNPVIKGSAAGYSRGAAYSDKTRPREGTPYLPKRKPRDDRLLWLGLGAAGAVLIVLALFIGISFLLNGNLISFLPSQTPTIPPSTAVPTLTQLLQPTSPSAQVLTATVTLPLSTQLPPGVPTATPTVLTGDPFVLLYDDTSFNFLNLSDLPRNISLILFERLDLAGNPLESFSGERWALFNEIIRPATCMRIEITDASFKTTPPECNNIFDAIRTTTSDSNSDFWTSQPNSSEFRVLWAGQEIKRCPIITHRCDLLIP